MDGENSKEMGRFSKRPSTTELRNLNLFPIPYLQSERPNSCNFVRTALVLFQRRFAY